MLVVGSEPFSLVLNPMDIAAPWPWGQVCSFYPATLVAMAVVAVAVRVALRSRLTTAPFRFLPTLFLPSYIGGIESVRLVSWSLRCHDLTAPVEPGAAAVSGAILSGVVLLATIALGGVGARALGLRTRFGLPVPAAPIAVLMQTMLLWWVLWSMSRPA